MNIFLLYFYIVIINRAKRISQFFCNSMAAMKYESINHSSQFMVAIYIVVEFKQGANFTPLDVPQGAFHFKYSMV